MWDENVHKLGHISHVAIFYFSQKISGDQFCFVYFHFEMIPADIVSIKRTKICDSSVYISLSEQYF